MRITPSLALPQPVVTPPPGAATAASGPALAVDRAALFRAVVEAQTLPSLGGRAAAGGSAAPAPLVAPPPASAASVVQEATGDALASLMRALPAAAQALADAGRAAPSVQGLPLPAQPPGAQAPLLRLPLPVLAEWIRDSGPALLAATTRERLASTVAGARNAPVDPRAAAAETPASRLAFALLEALSGEGSEALSFLSPGLRQSAGAAYAALAERDPDALLQVLVRGSVRSADGQTLDLEFRLLLERPPGAPAADPAQRAALRAALEALADARQTLDVPLPAARLAGASAHFEALLDPRGAAGLPPFHLAGWLMLGLPRAATDPAFEPEATAADGDGDRDDEASAEDTQEQAQQTAEAISAEADSENGVGAEPEQTPLPDDGGPPIISAQRWLELEFEHLRRQLRLWLLLPPQALAR